MKHVMDLGQMWSKRPIYRLQVQSFCWLQRALIYLGNNFPFTPSLNICFHYATFKNTLLPIPNSRGLLLLSVQLFCLSWVVFILSFMIFIFSKVNCINSSPINCLSPPLPSILVFDTFYHIKLYKEPFLLYLESYCYR